MFCIPLVETYCGSQPPPAEAWRRARLDGEQEEGAEGEEEEEE